MGRGRFAPWARPWPWRQACRQGGDTARAEAGGRGAPAAPRAEEPRRRERAPEQREPREPRTVYATDNNGPAVRGFGADIPAFMLIRKRGKLSEILEEPSEIEEDDVIHESHGGSHGGEDIAA